MQWLYEKHCLTSRICCKWMLAATQVDPKGWCALCRKDKPENASRNDVATVWHISLLVRSALPEELNQMAAGGDVKETVMTIPFLRACIINMIADQERKSISDGNKKRALAIPEAPWNWFTSYELGFPLLTDEHERPMHPLVEVFVDEQRLIGLRQRKILFPSPLSLVGYRQLRRDGATRDAPNSRHLLIGPPRGRGSQPPT